MVSTGLNPMEFTSVLQHSPNLWILPVALFIACFFEFINGFHDTANAVATVIYTKALKPWTAVGLSGLFNFLGVFLGGTAVAMSIIKLLPLNLLITHDLNTSLAMVMALLSAAIIWNFGTWYLGLPASSSHTLIGAIMGIGLANVVVSGATLSESISWSKAADIGLALLISPLVGFALAGVLLLLSKKLFNNPVLHEAPAFGQKPPFKVRALLILTSSGVSLAHGSNDGQKGVGLIMLILIALMPAQFSLRPSINSGDLESARQATVRIEEIATSSPQTLVEDPSLKLEPLAYAADEPLSSKPSPRLAAISAIAHSVRTKLEGITSLDSLKPEARLEIRSQLVQMDHDLSKVLKGSKIRSEVLAARAIDREREPLRKMVEYAPTWVLFLVAFSLGLGTLIGWKRIAVTIGEKIGKGQLTYAKGTVVQFVAMSTIGLSALLGLPVSTTHVLSSGVAGTMVAAKTGVNGKMISGILLAWVLTLPASMLLSAGLYVGILQIIK